MEEENNVPSAEVSANEPLSFNGALDILNAADAPVETPAASETAEAVEPDVEADQAEPSQDEAEAASDAEPEAELVLHGNAKTRLRNGQEVTIGDLKKRWEEAEEYKARLPEFETRQREIEQKAQAIAAQEQLFTNSIQQAQEILRANFPPKPDYTAVERGEVDIITYQEQVAKYNHAAEKWQQLGRAKQAHEQQAQQRQSEELKQTIAREVELLREKMPSLRSDEGFKAFREDILTRAPKEFGIAPEKLASIKDHTELMVLHDALAYRKLQAEKAKVAAKVKDVPPVQVQAPGRRASPAEKQAQVVKTGFERLRQTGSFEDALAILNQHDL
jgi:hypothetical protein